MIAATAAISETIRDNRIGIGQSLRREQAARAAQSAQEVFYQVLIEQPPDSLRTNELDFARTLSDCANHNIDVVVSEQHGQDKDLQKQLLEKEIGAVRCRIPNYQSRHIASGTSHKDACRVVAQELAKYAEDLVYDGQLGFVVSEEGKDFSFTYPVTRVFVGVSDADVHSSSTYDKTQPFFQRTTRTRKTNYKGKSWHEVCEYVHHCTGLCREPIKYYSAALPERVNEVKEKISSLLTPEARILSGQLLKEEKHVKASYQTEWEHTTVLVTKDCPALVIGGIVLAGWSMDDVEIRSNGKYIVLTLGVLALGALAWLWAPASIPVALSRLGVVARWAAKLLV